MKYFTPQLWLGFNSRHSKAAFKTYDRRLHSYRRQLGFFLAKLNPQAKHFFREPCLLHDGTLARLEVGDQIENAYAGLGRKGINGRRASVRLFVVPEKGDFIYTLHYKGVARVDLNFPGRIVLFPAGMFPNFGDWGYDELTTTRAGLYRHEILFASGSSLTIEFKEFYFRRKRAGQRS